MSNCCGDGSECRTDVKHGTSIILVGHMHRFERKEITKAQLLAIVSALEAVAVDHSQTEFFKAYRNLVDKVEQTVGIEPAADEPAVEVVLKSDVTRMLREAFQAGGANDPQLIPNLMVSTDNFIPTFSVSLTDQQRAKAGREVEENLIKSGIILKK